MEPSSLISVTEYKDIQNGPKTINEFSVEELRSEVSKLLNEKETIISEVSYLIAQKNNCLKMNFLIF